MASDKPFNSEIVDVIFPYLGWAILILFLSRILMMVVSHWHFGITKYYLYHQMLFIAIVHTLPKDYGDHHILYLVQLNYAFFLLFSFSFWPSIAAISAVTMYIGIFSRT